MARKRTTGLTVTVTSKYSVTETMVSEFHAKRLFLSLLCWYSDCLTSLIFILITSPSTWTNVVPFFAVVMLFLGKQMYLPSSEQLAGLYVKHELLSRK